ncbi:MAG: UDP-2,3-diacylglucosamine diphosphatase [Acidobacteria bacterium]|nr:UDP-2,3-diacylglucosamine diphosphatase [Acidobacteriota bacterium]
MERPFDTLILSDVHLGSEISRARDALDLLKSTSFRRLILLGDIFNDLNFRRLKKEHWQFLSYIRKLSNPKRNVEVVWVEGNHDLGLSDLMSHLVGIPVYQQYVWEYRGERCLAIHGHQFDRFVVNNFLISRLGEAVFLLIQKMDAGKKRFSRYLDRLNTRWLRLSDKVARGALAYAAHHSATRIFCGHTHVALEAERGKIQYFNAGSWVDKSCSYVTVGDDGIQIRTYAPAPQLPLLPEPDEALESIPPELSAHQFYRPLRA